ncbi:MAG TPA: hypothetical protein VFR88_08310 [Microlunatus sp.]|nr:hypothetical protein [Microlunatus sp.]
MTERSSSRGLPPLSTVVVGTLFFCGCIPGRYAGFDKARATGNALLQVVLAAGMVLGVFMVAKSVSPVRRRPRSGR